jgi:hypothetical protein
MIDAITIATAIAAGIAIGIIVGAFIVELCRGGADRG